MSQSVTNDLLGHAYIPERWQRAQELAIRGQLHSTRLIQVHDDGEVHDHDIKLFSHIGRDTSIAWCNTGPDTWVIVKMPIFLHHLRNEISWRTFTDEQIAITKLGGDWIGMLMEEFHKNHQET